jgi:hypothetical protein
MQLGHGSQMSLALQYCDWQCSASRQPAPSVSGAWQTPDWLPEIALLQNKPKLQPPDPVQVVPTAPRSWQVPLTHS